MVLASFFLIFCVFFFFSDTATTEIYTLSLHDALPIYQAKDGRKGWRGPLGSAEFFGRGIGSIEVKPGDSKTLFVASGRATRGISNTCCGGADALIPGAPHFGVWRSQDEGKSWT